MIQMLFDFVFGVVAGLVIGIPYTLYYIWSIGFEAMWIPIGFAFIWSMITFFRYLTFFEFIIRPFAYLLAYKIKSKFLSGILIYTVCYVVVSFISAELYGLNELSNRFFLIPEMIHEDNWDSWVWYFVVMLASSVYCLRFRVYDPELFD